MGSHNGADLKNVKNPNPFGPNPVKSISELSGRSSELSELAYFFEKTSNGSAGFCALTGPSGSGKTSILNCAMPLAEELKLLNIRISLDRSKTKTLKAFWKSIYVSLFYLTEKIGCWKSDDGRKAAAVAQGLENPEIADGLQLPRFWSAEDCPCSEVVITDDLLTIQDEILKQNFHGAAIYLDESDYLSQNEFLLQNLVTAFQGISNISIILAGSTTLFSEFNENNSFVPRLFTNIEVTSFDHWSDTQKMIQNALGDEYENVGPETETIMELHRLCGGNPAELQLYCEQMYRQIELNHSAKMELSANVYAEVSRSYRRSSSTNSGKAFKSVQKLSGFLSQCPWLQNIALTAGENTQLIIAREELERGFELSQLEITQRTEIVLQSYRDLYRYGISLEKDCLRLYDEECLKGYWKSLIRLEDGKPWSWIDQSFEILLAETLFEVLETKTASSHLSLSFKDKNDYFDEVYESLTGSRHKLSKEWQDAMDAIQKVVSEKSLDTRTIWNCFLSLKTFTSIADALFVLCSAYNMGEKNICRIPVLIKLDNFERARNLTFYDTNDPNDERFELEQFKKVRANLLNKHNIELTIGTQKLYKTPTRIELENMMEEIGFSFPLLDSPHYGRATKYAKAGNFQLACEQFELIEPKTSHVHNNIAFCKLLSGNQDDAKSHLEQALLEDKHPLFYNNLAIIDFSNSNIEACTGHLNQAWELMTQEDLAQEEVISMLVIEHSERKFREVDNIRLAIGLGLSICLMDNTQVGRINDFLSTQLSIKDKRKWIELCMAYEIETCKPNNYRPRKS
ncbi:MAG: ATP-binding protein [Candidatus Obscuribacter sp.]|jgi:tetratricopeptide (TPR) repeat protein|nr:ATP-binding protein [Candidatus Obscuribacter sp.]MBK9619314.1 ATP-binding protein [Candidatus Obscuribacter sp.]